ncbi:MAG: RsmB/NOP family class I SAM-dependent RNA methyltransferase [Alphaproteobacteria bacterium]|nr:RsmB/NOP family class I SAM-dependent RNA methyltransferase [Alphaproteobacteria bacterium]
MKPSARIQACIEVLERTANPRVPMDSCIGDYMRQRRYIGAKDRAAVVERVYSIVRHYARLGWWVEQLNLEDTPRIAVILWLALGEGIDTKRFHDLFDGGQYAPAPLNEAELAIIGKIIGQPLEPASMPLAVRLECPPQYEEKLRGFFGDAFEEEMRAMLGSATLDLRVNTFLMERENVKNSLEKDGVITTATPCSPWGLRCAEKVFLSKTKAFNKGWVEIQDEGSQMIAALCDAQPGMQVLDFCAGGGGKTLALAAAMKKKGRIVAMDNDSRRLEKGRSRYKKAFISDIVEVRPLDNEKNRKWLKRQKGTFDIVLLDVPCTGTGTWRRNPDTRWNTYAPPLEELLQTQKEIIERAASVVKPGGRLVYATCSLLPEENENQIERFLADHPEFSICPPPPELGAPYMRLTPLRHNTDGFFAAVLERADPSAI